MKRKLLLVCLGIGLVFGVIGCGSNVKQSTGVEGIGLSEEGISKLSTMGSSADTISYNFDNLVAKVGSSSYDLMSAKSNDIFPQLGMDIIENSKSFEFSEGKGSYGVSELTYTLKDGTVFIISDSYNMGKPDFRLLSYVLFDLSESKDEGKGSSLFGLSYSSTLENIQSVFGECGLYYVDGDTTSYWYDISVDCIPMEVEVVYNNTENHLEYIEVSTYFKDNFRFLSEEVKAADKQDLKK